MCPPRRDQNPAQNVLAVMNRGEREANRAMFAAILRAFRPRRAKSHLPGELGLASARGRSAPCALWTDYGTFRLSETKLQHPSPLAMLCLEKART